MSVQLTSDQVDDAHACIAKARGIVEIVTRAATAELGYHNGAKYSDSLWAATDSLDRLAVMLGLDKPQGERS